MLKSLEINGFKSFGSKSELVFDAPKSVIVGPNGSGKSNAAEAFRFVLGEQSLKTLRARNSDELLFNGGNDGRRANRASVKAVFDNSDNHLDIEYGEVVIERIIERGDASKYRINGSQVRLKDVVDLLSDANIGTSRHHIISQGEADKVLNINERERKSLIEDALGLQRFYRKRREAVRKLERTEENLNQVKQRRQDLQPELSYLRKQKTRIEKTKQLRDDLMQLYKHFFKREEVLIEQRETELKKAQKKYEDKKSSLHKEIAAVKETLSNVDTVESSSDQGPANELTDQINTVTQQISETTEALGRVNGQLDTLKRQQERKPAKTGAFMRISRDTYQTYKKKFRKLMGQAELAADEEKMSIFAKLRTELSAFLEEFPDNLDAEDQPEVDNAAEISELETKQTELREKRRKLEEQQNELRKTKKKQEQKAREQESQHHKADKKLLQLSAEKDQVESKLARVRDDVTNLQDTKEELVDEKSEARVLCGANAIETDNVPLVDTDGSEVSPEKLHAETSHRLRREDHRKLERCKIKLEETRVGDEQSVLQELERVTEQAEFLDAEMEDLQSSKDSLLSLIEEIELTVKQKFTQGVDEINQAFSDFFRTMFGGGAAELFITEHPKGKGGRVEDMNEAPDETEQGVGINIQLPNKKIRGLGVLSGGERSLVSIALLFALSQINPPPFVVLDEADAALDEANSRRFGDMIDQLSNRSQLIIITHNRETMSRADLLYGVTMDQVGGSRLLSLNFSDAVETVEG